MARYEGWAFIQNIKLFHVLRLYNQINRLSRSNLFWVYEQCERTYLLRHNSITYEELCNNPQNYVVTMSMWEIGQLVDIKPQKAIWIKSSCEPFCEEMELDEERKKHWRSHFKIQEFFAHALGHASGNEIRSMIKEISAQHVIPIHTEHPDKFE